LAGEVFPIKIGLWFSLDYWKLLSGRFWTLDERVNRSSVSINFLKQKYIHIDMLTRA